jgi:hypothetical protein
MKRVGKDRGAKWALLNNHYSGNINGRLLSMSKIPIFRWYVKV